MHFTQHPFWLIMHPKAPERNYCPEPSYSSNKAIPEKKQMHKEHAGSEVHQMFLLLCLVQYTSGNAIPQDLLQLHWQQVRKDDENSCCNHWDPHSSKHPNPMFVWDRYVKPIHRVYFLILLPFSDAQGLNIVSCKRT